MHERSATALRSIAGRPRPDGLLAVVERRPSPLAALEPSGSALLVVAQGIERPGNLGALVRTCAGAGAAALVVCDQRADPFHPDTVQGSVGTLFDVPLAVSSSPEAIGWLRGLGARVVVASPDGPLAYWEAEYRGRTAVVLGGERHGVTRAWLDAADDVVRIPMAAAADSLNVAVAAGVVLFEAARCRGEVSAEGEGAGASARPRQRTGARAAPREAAAATRGSAVPRRRRASSVRDPAAR